jgi:formate-dependent phosphoribosylglycinamide formyltransferase (GAR transformylase)
MAKQTEVITTALDEAIRQVIKEHDPGTIVTKWIAVVAVESMKQEESGTWILSPASMIDVDDMGMLVYALTDLKAQHIRTVLNELPQDDD